MSPIIAAIIKGAISSVGMSALDTAVHGDNGKQEAQEISDVAKGIYKELQEEKEKSDMEDKEEKKRVL